MRRRERVVSNRVIFDSELFFLALVPTKIIIRVAKTWNLQRENEYGLAGSGTVTIEHKFFKA
jgi:hypothetical protein